MCHVWRLRGASDWYYNRLAIRGYVLYANLGHLLPVRPSFVATKVRFCSNQSDVGRGSGRLDSDG